MKTNLLTSSTKFKINISNLIKKYLVFILMYVIKRYANKNFIILQNNFMHTLYIEV